MWTIKGKHDGRTSSGQVGKCTRRRGWGERQRRTQTYGTGDIDPGEPTTHTEKLVSKTDQKLGSMTVFSMGMSLNIVCALVFVITSQWQ